MQVTNEDLQKIKAFKLIMKKSKLDITGESAIIVGSLFNWFDNLENRFNESLKPLTPKEVKGKIKKVE